MVFGKSLKVNGRKILPLKGSLVLLASDIADKHVTTVWGEGRRRVKKQKKKLILWVKASPSHFKNSVPTILDATSSLSFALGPRTQAAGSGLP